MEIVMIKKLGCGPCKMYEPRIKEVAEKNKLEFRTLQGTNERKLSSVLKRHIQDFQL